VVDDGFAAEDAGALSVKGIDDRLFLHGPIVLPNFLWSDLQWIIYASNLRVVWGAADLPLFDEIQRNCAAILAAVYIIDFCESRMVQFADADCTGSLDMRSWCTRVWSVTHSVYLGKRFLDLRVPEHI